MTESSADSPVQDIRWQDKNVVVQVTGDIDLNSSPKFQQAVLSLMDKRPDRIIVNLSDVPYMDSSGVASLVKLLSRVRKSGAMLSLCCLNDRVRSVFEITRLDSVFHICNSEEEAMV